MPTKMRWREPVEELELPFPPFEPAAPAVPAVAPAGSCDLAGNPFAIFECCPMCGSDMAPEHAHFRCTGCGWRDSCCD
jgi:hypothetical protein